MRAQIRETEQALLVHTCHAGSTLWCYLKASDAGYSATQLHFASEVCSPLKASQDLSRCVCVAYLHEPLNAGHGKMKGKLGEKTTASCNGKHTKGTKREGKRWNISDEGLVCLLVSAVVDFDL